VVAKRVIDSIRDAIESHSDAKAQLDSIMREQPHLQRHQIAPQLGREKRKRRHIDTGADDTSDAFTYSDEEYTFDLAGEKAFGVPLDEVQQWVRWYVSDGSNLTQRTVTRMAWQINGRPLTKDFARRIFKMLGIDKSSPPFAPHLLQKYSPDELAKIHFATAQADVELKMRADEPKEWKAAWLKAEKRASQLETQLDDRNAFADQFAARISRRAERNVQPIAFVNSADEMLLVCVYDVHVGKLCTDGGDNGQKAIRANLELFEQVSVKPKCVELVFGGDFVNIDNERGTTRGTPQDNDRDWVDIKFEAWDVAEQIIEIWRRLGAPLTVRFIPGNHDNGTMYDFSAGFEKIYQATDVVCQRSRDEMQALVYGQNLIVLEHGDGIKPKTCVSVIANKYPRMWGVTRFRFVVTGHLHHVHEYDVGVTILQQPSLSGSDRWHLKNGYDSPKGMRMYRFDSLRGKTVTYQVGA
jgi:hypothetical protein